MVPSLLPKIKAFLILAKTAQKWNSKLFRISLLCMKTRACLLYFVNYCHWKYLFAVSLPQTPLKLTLFTRFITLKPIAQF